MADADRATEWTRGPAKWAAVGFLGGASVLGLVWSMSARVESPWAGVGASSGEVPRRVDAETPASTVAPTPTGLAGGDAGSGSVERPVPTPVAPAAPALDPRRKININTASAAELELLPDVGPALARAIVEHRTKHGPFRSVDRLDDVSGIGPKRLEKLRPLVVVE